jgi:hypothetical protein
MKRTLTNCPEPVDHNTMATPAIIQSLWIGKKLSVMEKLCISSFITHGHPFHLYIYDEVMGIPAGTIVKDASKILLPEKIFKYKDHDSYAGFANLFRYKLLLEEGNYWVDTDMVCLRPFQHNTDYVFASERVPSKTSVKLIQANNCLIKAPSGSAIMEYCYQKSSRKDFGTLEWGETGPRLLTEAITMMKMQNYVAKPKIFCPVNWWDWNQFLDGLIDDRALTDSHAVHLWNEMWRRNQVDKSGTFNVNSIYEQLKQTYLQY